ncbi:MAG: hypothetical protein ACE5KY_03175, partial [Candidatus Tectimicrobiota bacterium]
FEPPSAGWLFILGGARIDSGEVMSRSETVAETLPCPWNPQAGLPAPVVAALSLVGPRPLPLDEHAAYRQTVPEKVASRATLRAGWTGLSILEKDASRTYGQMGERGFVAERRYWELLQRGSALAILRLDGWIIWRTLFIIAKGEGL